MDSELPVVELQERAESGDVDAQYSLGQRFFAGTDLPQDLPQAAKWFANAAAQGHVRAQFNLACMLAAGEGVERNLDNAERWYKRAAEQGFALAQNNLALQYEHTGRLEEAAHWYRKAADQGLAAAQASLAYAYSQGRGVEADIGKSIDYYRMAADQGYAAAQSNLGGIYLGGRGVAEDPVQAIRWLTLAANQGYAPAQSMLGGCYAKGTGVERNASVALDYLLRAAAQGNAEAQNGVAIHFARGDGVDEDRVRALVWFALAAGQGNADGLSNIARVHIDHATDVCKLITSAAGGDLDAQRTLAVRLHNGDGIKQDIAAARLWVRKAAEQGDSWSQTAYAIDLRSDKDPDKQRESVWWLTQAASQGDDRARLNLGLSQATGVGTPIDWESAAVNVLQASLGGFEEARGAFQKIRPAIREELWPRIFERVKWPDISFILGPLVEGHLDAIRLSQENDDGSDDALWLKYERDVANITFPHSPKSKGSVLDAAFGEPVSVTKIHVGRASIGGKSLAAITINLQNIRMADGFPVFWKPSEEGLNAVTSMLGLLGGRTGVRWSYFTF